MPRRAWIYLISILLIGALLAGLSLASLSPSSFRSPTFAFLLVAATLAQLFKVRGPSHEAWHINLVFIFAGLLLLPSGLFVLLVIIPHLLEWAKERLVKSRSLRNWYIQPFNIATHIISGLAGYWVLVNVGNNDATLATTSSILVITVAGLIYLLLNHALVGQVLVLARGMSWRETGVFDLENLVTDLGMLLLGYMLALLWQLNPLMILLMILPLFVIYRSMMIPQLKKEARTDEKTGLWNSRYLLQLLDAEIERSKRSTRPLAFLMMDLDALREINNRHGHLIGDAVLARLSQIIRDSIRPNDIAGRFGGDEFGIVLTELEPQEAQIVAERLCRTIASTGLATDMQHQPIHATISIGVAAFPSDAVASADLVRQADKALYQAKLRGRNQVVGSWDVPHSIKLTGMVAPNTEASPQPRDTAPKVEAAAGETDSQRSGELVQKTTAGQAASAPAAQAYPKMWLWLFIAGTVAAALLVAILGLVRSSTPDLVALAMLSVLAVITQLPQTKNLYDQSSVSVSVTVNFAAALIAGLPGVVCVSGVIAIAHYIQRKPAVYKTLFNWATHVLAGAAPVFALAVLGLQEQVTNLLLVFVPLCLAALTYFAIDTGFIATAISLSTGAVPFVTWRKQFSWLAPHYFVLCLMGLFLSIAYFALGILGVGVFTLPVLMMAYVQRQYKDRTAASTNELQRMYQELSRANHEVFTANQAIQELNEELFQVTAQIIDARDPFAAGHATKVAEYAVAVATEMGWPSKRIAVLRHAAFLHDIGKLGTPEGILTSGSKLDAHQTEIIRRHPTLGAEFLQNSQALRHLAPFVRSHHERWDGGGYPDGLVGEMIPPEGRILCVCDAVEAMASDRPYHRGIPLRDVVSELKRCSGKQFDPTVVEAFLRVIARDGNILVANSADEVARSQERATKW